MIEGDPKVSKFTEQFLTLFNTLDENGIDTVAKVFSQGYCYYFAIMLKEAFNRGEVCMTIDHTHVVWVDNNLAYDIHGVFGWYSDTANKDNYWHGELIPVEKLPHYIDSFKHIPDKPGTDKTGMLEFDNVKKDIENKKNGMKDFINVKIWSFDDPLNPIRFSNVDETVDMILKYEETNGMCKVMKGHRSVDKVFLEFPDMWVYGLRYDSNDRTFYGNIRMPDTALGDALREAYQKNPNMIRIFPVIFGSTPNGIYYHAQQFAGFAYEIIAKIKDYEKFIQEISEEPITEMREINEGPFNKEETK